jgi:hypothetical protein
VTLAYAGLQLKVLRGHAGCTVPGLVGGRLCRRFGLEQFYNKHSVFRTQNEQRRERGDARRSAMKTRQATHVYPIEASVACRTSKHRCPSGLCRVFIALRRALLAGGLHRPRSQSLRSFERFGLEQFYNKHSVFLPGLVGGRLCRRDKSAWRADVPRQKLANRPTGQQCLDRHNEGLVQICAGKEEKEREKASFRQVALVRGNSSYAGPVARERQGGRERAFGPSTAAEGSAYTSRASAQSALKQLLPRKVSLLTATMLLRRSLQRPSVDRHQGKITASRCSLL